MISGSDCSLYVGVMQEAVRQHYMEGEQTTPAEERERQMEITAILLAPSSFSQYEAKQIM